MRTIRTMREIRRYQVRVRVLPRKAHVASRARARDLSMLALREVHVHGPPCMLDAAALVRALCFGQGAAPLVLCEHPTLKLLRAASAGEL
jgi:hypothetical protein